jgi:DNA-binding response OmpR family regulator
MTPVQAAARARRPAREGPTPQRHLRPVGERAEEASESPREAAHRVLVVDDEPSMRTLCCVNLELAGFEVSEAADGSAALALARDQDFDLILLDVMLPDIGGLEVAERLAAQTETREVPVAFMSARTAGEDLRRGYERGAVDYITKPFDPLELAGRVREIVGRVERGESERFRAARLAEFED